MPARLVNLDPDTPLLLPPDLRAWVPGDHLVHFIMGAVGLLDLGAAHVNHCGSGSAQYPPSLMLGLLIYSDATGTFSSKNPGGRAPQPPREGPRRTRKLERGTLNAATLLFKPL